MCNRFHSDTSIFTQFSKHIRADMNAKRAFKFQFDITASQRCAQLETRSYTKINFLVERCVMCNEFIAHASFFTQFSRTIPGDTNDCRVFKSTCCITSCTARATLETTSCRNTGQYENSFEDSILIMILVKKLAIQERKGTNQLHISYLT